MPIRSMDIDKTDKIGPRYRDIDDIRVQRLDLIDPIALIDLIARATARLCLTRRIGFCYDTLVLNAK